MKTNHAGNIRTKRAYFAYLKGPMRQSEQSVDAAAKALSRFETYTRHKDFKTFRKEQAIGFQAHLADQVNIRTKERLSKATLFSTLAALKAFFVWLSGQPGFKSRLTYSDADYFNLSAKDTAIAKAVREIPVPTIEQIRHVVFTMPDSTDIEKRDRALIAFTLLTGARDNAIASMRLRHVDLDAGRVDQDARQVRTKYSKTFPTFFYPVGDDIRAIFEDWVTFLQREKFWGLDDPLFPKTHIANGPGRLFEAEGLERQCWSSAEPIRAIFRRAFEAASLPYYNPHSFRKTLARLGQTVCRTFEQHKAWSQNLGHDDIRTTLVSYGTMPAVRQAELIRELGMPRASGEEVADLVRRLMDATGAGHV
jgi:integrase/recombinase XerD